MRLCGWDVSIENNSINSNLIEVLESERKYIRAAAISVFCCKIKRAIQSLKKAADRVGDSNLSAIAMALSGYTKDKNSLWREMCQNLRSQISGPYLKAIFTFLTCESDNFSDILVSKLSDF